MNYQHCYQDGSPIDLPLGKVVCVGRNYAAHAAELNNPLPEQPLLFIKPGSCTVPFKQSFAIPNDKGAVHHEAEIAVLLGKPLSGKVCAEQIMQSIIGYAPALDLTLRDVQDKLKKNGHPWELAKAFDGAYVLAPFVPAKAIKDTANIAIELRINGVVRQQGNSREMHWPIIRLIRFIAEHFSLQAGDVISTGTPAGVGALQSGDRLELSLRGHVQWVCSVRQENSA